MVNKPALNARFDCPSTEAGLFKSWFIYVCYTNVTSFMNTAYSLIILLEK